MSRLRATRDAIDALGDRHLPPNEGSDPLKVITDPQDRRRLARYLEELEYLTGLTKLAWDEEERQRYVRAIQEKAEQIDDLYVRYTGQTAPGGPQSETAGPWQPRGKGDCCPACRGEYTRPGDKPSPGECVEGFRGKTAICWDGKGLNNKYNPGVAFCVYKNISASACLSDTSIREPQIGKVYECVPD
jgi:hypothetical protein